MADSTSTPSTSNNASTVADSSTFGCTVCLYDWWLVKAENDFEGKWLAVSGITSRKEKAVRVFVSAPVVKRYDLFSLETADGIYIVIRGFINEQRTIENGFPPEVFNNFLFGFPPNWDNFAVDWFRNESTTRIDLGSSVPENVSPIDPEVLSDGVEKSAPTLSKSPEEALTVGGVNFSHDSDSNRRTTRSHNIKIFQQKKPTAGVVQKHPNKEQNSVLGALDNPGGERLESPMAPVQLQSLVGQVNTTPKQLVKNSSLAVHPEVLSDVVKKSAPTLSKSPEDGLSMGGVNVSHGSDGNRRTTRSHNMKLFQREKPASGVAQKHPKKEQNTVFGALENPGGERLESPMAPVQLQSPVGQVNTTPKQLVKNSSLAVRPEVLSDVVKKSAPTLSKSPEDGLTMGGVNVSHGSDSNRRTTRSHNMKLFQREKPASGVATKHPNKEQNSVLGALENPGVERLDSPMAPVQSQSSVGQVNTPPKQLVKNSSLAIRPEVLSDEKSAPTSSKSPEDSLTMGGINVSHGSDSYRRTTRSHNIKVFQRKKPAFGVAQKHPNKEQNSALGTLENYGGEGLESPMAPVQLQSPGGQVNTPPKQLVENSLSAIGPKVFFDEKSIPTSKSPGEALGTNKNSFPREECHASKETTCKVDAAHGRGSNRPSTRLHNIKVCKQKNPASESFQKHLDKEQHSSSGALENLDGERLESPITPVQSQSMSQVNTLSKKLVKNSASMPRPFSANDECCLKKQKVNTPKRKKAGSVFANKYRQERDAGPLIKGGKEKISSVSPLSSSIRKSRSGRLLLPPLEFWRNQIPVYDADHEITEIREGASVISPFKGSSQSLSRFHKKKRAA